MQKHNIQKDIPRPLPIALAHCLANCRPGVEADQVRLGILNRIYAQLRPIDQIRTRNELLECREAQRGQREAAVVFQSDAKGG